MKIKNVPIPPLLVEEIFIPRQGAPIIFKARGVLNADYDDFDRLCPAPEIPWVVKRGSDERYQDRTDGEYLEKVNEWSRKRFLFMVLRSLSATEGLTWDTVQENDPETWKNLDIELKKEFTAAEYMRIIRGVHAANGLDEGKIEEAKKRFALTAENKGK